MNETNIEAKTQHLNFIQGVINRLAGNYFLIKGWMITMALAGYGFGFEKGSEHIIHLIMLAILLFWIIDAYYLQQEKIFRGLYDRCVEGEVKLFCMDTSYIKTCVPCLVCVMASYPTNIFYLPFLLVGILPF